jgi:Phytanoyl-CoA dioxygenase (PhyH)
MCLAAQNGAVTPFDERGFVHISGAFPAAAAARMCERLWDELARRHGIRRDDPATWTVEQPCHFQALRRSGAFEALASPVLLGALDDLLGAGAWLRPDRWGEPLVRFPGMRAAWDVPVAQWHIDWPARGATRPLFGCRVLAFVSPVAAGGGGTVVLAGSHRLVERAVAASRSGDAGHSPALRKALARAHPWLHDLWSRPAGGDRIARFMRDGAVLDGVDLRVVELTGAAGDAVVFHPWLFHAPSPNRAREPRMMVGQNVQTASGVARYAPVVRHAASR